MVCVRRIGLDLMPFGRRVGKGTPRVSHGLCLACLPDWGRKAGFTEAQIQSVRRASLMATHLATREPRL